MTEQETSPETTSETKPTIGADGNIDTVGGRQPRRWVVYGCGLGLLLMVVGSLLSWSYNTTILGNLSLVFNPGALQIVMIVVAVVGAALLLCDTGPLSRTAGRYLEARRALPPLGIWVVVAMLLVLLANILDAGGLVNVQPGAWIVLVGGVLVAVLGRLLWPRVYAEPGEARLPSQVELALIVVVLAAVLFSVAYALGRPDQYSLLVFLSMLVAVAVAAVRSHAIGFLSAAAGRHRRVITLGAFVVAFLFPFTQHGSDANMSIATQVLVFAVTAMGLNIVVGLAGLLDLGYIAFLGSGAYTAAMMSNSLFATINFHPPFIVVMLIAAAVSGTLGLIIGSPTLRLSGDYLAIVTLGFGEIFRITMNNLDGSSGPDLTHGPNGIPNIPDLKLFGFNFGSPHTVFGITLGRFTNYYALLLVLIAVVILIFTRLNDSRIGRGWVAIREDERAASAMGVNVFALKLLAFAIGAVLAGVAGTIKAHQDILVVPDQYVFLESSFLVAAIVLGGMGTVAGVLLGATILRLLPEKLRFFDEYRLLLFGLLLVVMMRFRPEGLVASKRRQLELHKDDEELADLIGEESMEEARAT